MAKITLRPDEILLRKDSVNFFTKKVSTRVGTCFLTSQRVVTFSDPLIIATMGVASIIVRAVLKKLGRWQSGREEAELRDLQRVTLSQYGLNEGRVTLDFRDGTQIRIATAKKRRAEWLDALDLALRDLGLERVPDGEDTFAVEAVRA